MSEDHATHEHPVTPLGRTARSLLWRRWPEFAVELVLIIVGIMVALAIDGWVQERSERRAEVAYLELLRDDLVEIENQLQRYVDFESENIEIGIAVFHAMNPANHARDPRNIQGKLAALGARRTVQISSAAYTDLQSTGNLKIIRNRELRQRIVRYFVQTERAELVAEKNNSAFVDNLFNPFLLRAGVTIGLGDSQEPIVSEANRRMQEALGADVDMPYDEILHLPPDAPSWENLRRQVFFRVRIASVGATLGERTIDATLEIRAAIEEELRNSI